MKDQPFLLPILGLVLGIALGQLFPESDWRYLELFLLGGLILIFSFGEKFQFNTGLFVFVFFVFLGILRFQKFNSIDLIQYDFPKEKTWVKLKIENTYKSSEKYRKYKAKLIAVDTMSFRKINLLLYWKKNQPQLHPNEVLWVYCKIQTPESPKNPHQFDYQKYLKRQRIQFSAFADSLFVMENDEKGWHYYTAIFKTQIREKLLLQGYTKTTTDIIGAMLLGDRTEMDEEIEENYRKTGVVHILSISGLHVVMVYTIFYFLLYPLVYLPRGKSLRIICCLSFIWFYALFVEMQPPVARSAMMISIFHLTLILGRKPNIYHTLIISALVLLLCNPNFLFDVGFQLSYAAVFFIVWLMPIYKKIMPTKNRKLIYIRDFVGTSISAQLGTFPIAAFYFHQSSGLFLAGNVLMVPASFLMILGGMFSILLAVCNINFYLWILIFNNFFDLCNAYIGWLSSHKSWVFENISFNPIDVLILIILIVGIRFLVLKHSPKYVISILGLFFLLKISQLHKIHSFSKKEELIVFHQYKNSVIGIRNGTNLDVFVSKESDSEKLYRYVIKPYEIHEGIQSINYFGMDTERISHYLKTKDIISWKENKILIGNQNLKLDSENWDYILVQNSSEINHNSDEKKTEFILDGSNYPNHLQGIKEAWRTNERGAKRIIP